MWTPNLVSEYLWTRDRLFALLSLPESREVTIKGVTGIVRGVEREDGSGRSFNVTMRESWTNRIVTVYVLTVG